MELDPENYYRAVRCRDARFDGRFYTAVRTTGIYCRPICPARTPKLANLDFYACAAMFLWRAYVPATSKAAKRRVRT